MLDIKKILSKSVGLLLDSRDDISRLNLSKQMGVADGTLGRIKYGNGNPNVETVETIARFFRYQPWQLMVDGFSVQSPPHLHTANEIPENLSEQERELVRVVRLLREPERTYLFQQARHYMESMEESNKSGDKSRKPTKNGTDDEPDHGPLWGTW